MKSYDHQELVITGIGITTAVGQGKEAVTNALLEGCHAFRIMERPGRQEASAFIGAEIDGLIYPPDISKKTLRTASYAAEVALVTLHEAWEDAQLQHVDPTRVGLIIGGSNVQQRDHTMLQDNYRGRTQFIRPTYGLSFMDSDLCGLCTEQFGIRGLAHTVGGASASGQLAILSAIQAVLSGEVDVCIAIGSLMDLSYWEFHGLRALGAMGTTKFADNPTEACRPFDREHDGFIYGECCGALVIERSSFASQRHASLYAGIAGWGMTMDANRNPNPSLEGECTVIRKALNKAGLLPKDIDYINPHGTGSLIGDEIELEAIQTCNLSHAYMNTTKSIFGHGLTGAGAVELIATILQMETGMLHPSRNLINPIVPGMNWVKEQAIAHPVHYALSLSFGFGGINTAICLQR
ncbi:beta-ketoacyl synthase N-terminal-like domain-containing protein [Chitinophaga rhizophila]|uniref:Polyketide beta-ketoacyl:ACP synthase n=1 Tax=Chitinophaga rhizophila TaxID=2866212 RepID=A0ABS7GLM9_9BACT|nr:beta-ketoacyl synthase N-terminal-like domain-containing protein [Chitinophaga rhizophila]MBW8688276.1 polyketide beta-ketoacyl:ACP synthase [Chitinophaga rhizophila]